MRCSRSFGIGLVVVLLSLAAIPTGQALVGGPTERQASQDPSPAWTQAALAPDRWWAAATFASSTCEVVAYGGDTFNASGSSVRPTDTLIYQPGQDRWLSFPALKTGAPPPTNHAGLTFDPNHGIAMLFGGSSFSRATYAFEPTTRKWTTLISALSCTSTTCPAARTMHAQAWSTVKGAVLVFGGQGSSRQSSVTNDLWALLPFPAKRGGLTWKWTPLAPTGDRLYGFPPARARHGMAEIPDGDHAGKMVIYGGWDARGVALSDTWLYDPVTNAYEKLPEAGSPTQRQGFAMGYSPSLNAVIVQGGQVNPGIGDEVYTQDTWAFDNDSLSWVLVTVGDPSGNRSYHDLASDTCRGTAIIFDKPATASGRYPTWILK